MVGIKRQFNPHTKETGNANEVLRYCRWEGLCVGFQLTSILTKTTYFDLDHLKMGHPTHQVGYHIYLQHKQGMNIAMLCCILMQI